VVEVKLSQVMLPSRRMTVGSIPDYAALVALPSAFVLNAVVAISRQSPFSPHLRFVG
jgi:hypothetical protein